MSQHAPWNLDDVAWDSRAMVMIPAAGPAGRDAVASSHGRDTRNHGNPRGSRADLELAPRATSAATMPHAVRCAHEGCGVMFHYSMQSRVRLGSVFCSAHQPVALPGGKDQPRSAKSDSGSGKSSDGKLSPEPPEPNAMSPAVTNGAAASAAARIRGDGTARTTGPQGFPRAERSHRHVVFHGVSRLRVRAEPEQEPDSRRQGSGRAPPAPTPSTPIPWVPSPSAR